MDLELRHLKAISVVAEVGSVTKAASVLGIAQPALTAQLHRIERVLGGPLFDRDRRGARPTALGELVLSRARLLLPAMSALEHDARRLANGSAAGAGAIRVGTVGSSWGGRFVHHLVTARPEASVSTHLYWSVPEVAELVARAAQDCAVVGMCGEAAPAAQPGLMWSRIGVDPVFVLVHDGHALADRDEITLADLADETWAGGPGEGCFEQCFVAACARAGFTPRAVCEIDASACVDLVSAGDVVALCQPTFRPPAGIRMLPVKGAPLRWTHYLGRREDGGPSWLGDVEEVAAAAYAEAIAASPRYTAWLDEHPTFGPAYTSAI